MNKRITVIATSFLISFLLVLVPLPEWASMYRPDWVVLVLIYWCLEIPDRVGPVAGWIVGLLVDVTQTSLLGLNALGMALVGYITNRFHYRLRMFPWWQQAVSVFFILLLYRALVGWIKGFIAPTFLDYTYWVPSLIGMIIWPWLFIILSDASRASKVR